uniref:Uncharacterized protein n=1 Tax=Picea glauca TaxID=3330 RepID=A0A101LZS4_PICGL|nr:hypothetical protein ABT39_MTgene5272 [Picea glauca]QHR88845.1 hypothetical protein Q903MT_gene2864 [Picea sitchensis]
MGHIPICQVLSILLKEDIFIMTIEKANLHHFYDSHHLEQKELYRGLTADDRNLATSPPIACLHTCARP